MVKGALTALGLVWFSLVLFLMVSFMDAAWNHGHYQTMSLAYATVASAAVVVCAFFADKFGKKRSPA